MAIYTKGTGVPGNGPYAGGAFDLNQTSFNGVNFDTFGCKVIDSTPVTPDYMTAANAVYFARKVFTGGERVFPDGVKVAYWGFEDTIKAPGATPLPSPIIRLQEGQLAHVLLETRKGPHTIHHHGIEPSTMNDGVGHVSFEVDTRFVYQWRPKHPGTWFYHCHRNTVLHFNMGLYGLLVVDPLEGWGYPFSGPEGAKYKYDVEAMWVTEAWDPRWHNVLSSDHAAGLCGEDVGLNIYKPRYFLVSGADKSKTATDSRVAIRARTGQKVLIRLLNAAYCVMGVKVAGIPAKCISIDGHALAGSDRPWSKPYDFAAGEEIRVTTAMRHDLWLDTTGIAPGTYPVTFTYYDWIKKTPFNPGQGQYEGKASSFITITA